MGVSPGLKTGVSLDSETDFQNLKKHPLGNHNIIAKADVEVCDVHGHAWLILIDLDRVNVHRFGVSHDYSITLQQNTVCISDNGPCDVWWSRWWLIFILVWTFLVDVVPLNVVSDLLSNQIVDQYEGTHNISTPTYVLYGMQACLPCEYYKQQLPLRDCCGFIR